MEVQKKVESYLTKEFGQIVVENNGCINIPYQTTIVTISCHDYEDSVVVRISGLINRNCKFKKDIYEWMAKKNLELLFGNITHFETTDGNMTTIQCNLLGDDLDHSELTTALLIAGLTADRLDEEFQSRFGGQRFIDGHAQ